MGDKYAYDIDWNKVKTIHDLKLILQIVAEKLVIDHSDPEDLEVFEKLKHLLVTDGTEEE